MQGQLAVCPGDRGKVDALKTSTLSRSLHMMRTAIALLTLGLTLSNCATITRGTTEAFTITSDPKGADIRLSNGLACQTPCALEVKRRPGFVVTASKPGYKTVTTSVVSSISGGGGTAMAGNLLLGGE
jgi:hypothetical protein